jgi:predicted NBD/HSP70 family sugar kinase
MTSDRIAGVLVVDAGGTNIKIMSAARKVPLKIPSGPTMTASRMVRVVKRATRDWAYDRVSIGFPGPVVAGRSASDPVNLGRGWKGFDFREAFGRPVKVINDAAMQALGCYRGGRMLFLGLGTGLGTALVVDGVLQPLELSHLPYKDGKSYEDFLGRRGLRKHGAKKWRREVLKISGLLKFGLQVDEIVLGGGNAKKLKEIPPGARRVSNAIALEGGLRLWERAGERRPRFLVK